MNNKFIKLNILFFLFIYIVSSIVLSYLNHRILINDFINLDSKQNTKNLEVIFNQLDSKSTNLKNILNDYSKWDDTYDFISNGNKEYIYDNFREGSDTLLELEIDFVIFSNLKNKVVYSNYIEKLNDKSDFENKLLKNFNKVNTSNSFFKYKNRIVYIVKEDVLKSDSTGKSNGYMLGGVYLTKENISDMNRVFKSIVFSNKSFVNNNIVEKLKDTNTVKIKIEKTENLISNNIQFYDFNNKYIFTLIANNDRPIIKKGENTILVLNIILSLFLLIIFFLFYRNQLIMEKYSSSLELLVDKRTQELREALEELKVKNIELDKISRMDPLTDINNRRSFFLDGTQLLKKAIKEKNPFCLVLIDIDFFKKINDTYGHSIGDEVLIEFCKIVNSIIDEKYIFGRLGGEEFAIIFDNIDIEEATIISEEIRVKIQDNILKIDGSKIQFTISLGLVQRTNEGYIDELLVIADELLYEAKDSGRNKLIRETVRK